MQPSERCIAAIAAAEGFRACAYQDMGGHWTIGYGCAEEVREGQTITEENAKALLRQQANTAAAQVAAVVKVPLTQGQADALVDFAYNLGIGHLTSSTLLRKLNAGDYVGAAAQFTAWELCGGHVEPGLVKRRQMERDWFLEESDATCIEVTA